MALTRSVASVHPGPLRQFLRRLTSQPVALVCLAYIGGLIVVTLIPSVLAPQDPLTQDLGSTFQPPSRDHLMGTDELGRDVFSRMIFAGRISFIASLQAVALSVVIGVPVGAIAGYAGGWIDAILSRLVDTMMTFPPLLFAVAIVGIFGTGLRNAMLAIGLVFAPRFMRITRSAVLKVREETFIEASRSIGTSALRIMAVRVLPNAAPAVIVQISLSLGFAMLAEASLSFLGLGVQPPEASWGSMVGRGYRFLDSAPTLIIFPGLAIATSVLMFSLLGDAVRDSIGRMSTTRAAMTDRGGW